MLTRLKSFNLPFIIGVPLLNSIIFSANSVLPFRKDLDELVTMFLLYLQRAASLNTSNISLTRAAYPANATNSYFNKSYKYFKRIFEIFKYSFRLDSFFNLKIYNREFLISKYNRIREINNSKRTL